MHFSVGPGLSGVFVRGGAIQATQSLQARMLFHCPLANEREWSMFMEAPSDPPIARGQAVHASAPCPNGWSRLCMQRRHAGAMQATHCARPGYSCAAPVAHISHAASSPGGTQRSFAEAAA